MHICSYFSNQEEQCKHIWFSAVPEERRWGRNRGHGGETTLPASDVDDEGRRDNTGVGIATLSTAAGFLLVIMLQAELSILL